MKKYSKGLIAGCLLALALTACTGGGLTNGNAGSSGSETGEGTGASPAASSDGNASHDGSKKTIVFSTFWQDPKYEEAKKEYEALHPDVEIKLENVDYTDATLEADMEKYVTTTNAAMLAGKGPDLLEMDMLPVDSYMKHGLLTDLSPMMAQDNSFKKADYFMNVIDNVRAGDSLYSMPLSFFLMGFAGDEGAIGKTGVKVDDQSWSWADFTKTAKSMTATGGLPSVLSYEGPEYLLGEMVSDNYSLFVEPDGRKAHFDSASFTGLMKQVKGMFDEGLVSKIGRGANAYFQSVQINSPKDYLESMQVAGLQMKMFAKEDGDHMKLYAKPHAQDTAAGGYFKTYRSVAISENSKVKPEAWDFIKFMLSQDIQSAATTTGFPVNKAAYAIQIGELKKQGAFKSAEEGPLHGSMIQADGGMLSGLDTYVNGAVHPAQDNKSDKMRELIITESKAYFAGQKTAEAVANLVQNKAMTYLNE
ncbi:ABC transporter substrate-binding protein [Paenibacillus glycanilyticus]|uniref:ABC transporter substrate-binding protein n=1 Tax=Paenibacillus glycanilyticus TaxID=126569 RepID=UPI0020421EE4|nr:ABC transporter substrate-binding protein [Paenibacillus glycanilyticus]MCM3628324.1 ABC transporter substrate-binding protein [Paenibacillus glycanilyticus]